ncbi:hypothetical protein HMPREF9554_02191 [Treponema phagedenis F0421]|nr:hypothetical protein HMPREF9554_02191 [Treponema phagedenis F0421]
MPASFACYLRRSGKTSFEIGQRWAIYHSDAETVSLLYGNKL